MAKRREQPASLRAPRPIPAGVRLPRLKQYRALINDVLKVKPLKGQKNTYVLSGSRRALLIFFAAWLDAYDYPEVQKTLLRVLEWTWGNGKRVQDTCVPQATVANAEAAAQPGTDETAQQIKSIFDLALKGEQ